MTDRWVARWPLLVVGVALVLIALVKLDGHALTYVLAIGSLLIGAGAALIIKGDPPEPPPPRPPFP